MSQIRTWQHIVLLGIAILLWSFSSPLAFAQEVTCGSFIYGPDYSEPVGDCGNPFGRTDDLANFLIGNETAVNNQTYLIDQQGSTDYGLAGDNYFNSANISIFRHEGEDYVSVSTDFAYPERSAIEQKIAEYFNNEPVSIAQYTEIYDASYQYPYFYDNAGSQYFDGRLNRYVEDVYYELESYIEQNVRSDRAVLLPGTYTVSLVDTDEGPVMSLGDTKSESNFKRLWASLVPKAHAYYYVRTVTFTLTDTPPAPAPTGASSVLFLPGIMGSRLYEEGEFCEVTNGEHQLWFSLNDCFQQRLTTKFTGQTVNPIYTKPGTEGVLDDVFAGIDIYDTFLRSLENWKDTDVITDYTAFPYDWRVGLDDIVKSKLDEQTGKMRSDVASSVLDGYLYEKLEELASSSKSGKVTIVAHSNGGLVAKHFLYNLQVTNDPLLEKIDNLILVAVPQIGTPDSIIGILHGIGLGPFKVVMSEETSRQLSKNMAFSHHLLPTLSYFDSVSTPVITFEEGSSTDAWRSTYGQAISDRDVLHSFLDKDSGRQKPAIDDLATPEVVDGLLLSYANTAATIQSSWQPSGDMKIYQIAGTGLETPSGITYFTDKECVSRILFICTEYQPKLGYRVNMITDGDESVVVPSALAISTSSENVERRWVNLERYNVLNLNRKHKDIFEVEEISIFIKGLVQGTTSNKVYTYLTSSLPLFNNSARLVFQLHSPLDMSFVASTGQEVSSSTNTITGATYRRYGELQYISVPKAEALGVLNLNGLAAGSFTLDIEEIGGTDDVRRTYSAIPSSTSTEVKVVFKGATALSEVVLEVDYEGDGVVDVAYNTEGVVEDIVTYEDLYKAIKDLSLKKLAEYSLLKTVKTAEGFYNKSLTQIKFVKLEVATLQALKKQLVLYEKLRLINGAQRQGIEVIINTLLK